MGLQPDNRILDPSYYEKETPLASPSFEGSLAARLGIQGTFDPDVADRLFRGMEPNQEKRLTARIDKDRVGAWDWTFTDDKSVSIAMLVGGDHRILDVQQEAVDAAMQYVQDNAQQGERRFGEPVITPEGKPVHRIGLLLAEESGDEVRISVVASDDLTFEERKALVAYLEGMPASEGMELLGRFGVWTHTMRLREA